MNGEENGGTVAHVSANKAEMLMCRRCKLQTLGTGHFFFSSGFRNNNYRKSDIRKDWNISNTLILCLTFDISINIAYFISENKR